MVLGGGINNESNTCYTYLYIKLIILNYIVFLYYKTVIEPLTTYKKGGTKGGMILIPL